MKGFKTLLAFLALGFLGLFLLGYTPTDTPSLATTEAKQTQPDYTLEIPEIGLISTMDKISRQGTTFTVPDNVPGYYAANDYNLFIVGHNHAIFKRLDEIPSQIILWLNGEPRTYNLADYKIRPKNSEPLKELLEYHGIVIMTCAGEYTEQGYSHRLVLYFR